VEPILTSFEEFEETVRKEGSEHLQALFFLRILLFKLRRAKGFYVIMQHLYNFI
jgi:hypothetical protein